MTDTNHHHSHQQRREHHSTGLQQDNHHHKNQHHHEDAEQQQQREHHSKPKQHHRHHDHHHHHHHHLHHNQDDHLHHDAPRRSILIAMDGSPHSFFAFDWYMANLHTADTEVIVAHSSCHNASFPPVHTLMSSGRDSMAMSRAEQQEEEEVDRIVTQIKGRLTQAGVRGKLLRLSGEPGPAIVHAGVDHNATCIVTGSRGLGTVKRALIGSVSDYILHHAHCPVMVCRHKEPSHKDKDK